MRVRRQASTWCTNSMVCLTLLRRSPEAITMRPSSLHLNKVYKTTYTMPTTHPLTQKADPLPRAHCVLSCVF